jgi:catechol 2,3-dioxygenase-like lactoylglutathione lyase family enzyme
MNNALVLPALAPFFPGIVTARFFETWDFYTTHLRFGTLYEDNQTLRLVHESGVQIAILREETEGQPAELVSATYGRGFWLSVDVADVAADYSRLLAAGVDVALPLEDMPEGERRFALRDPNGILIFLTQKPAVLGRDRRFQRDVPERVETSRRF